MFCGIDGFYSTADFWVHDAGQLLLGSFNVDGTRESGQMVVTPDGLMVVVLTDDPVMGFVPIGAAP